MIGVLFRYMISGFPCVLGLCRGPILLCVDTSGSMRGAREVVAKALALECMRAAKAQVCNASADPLSSLQHPEAITWWVKYQQKAGQAPLREAFQAQGATRPRLLLCREC